MEEREREGCGAGLGFFWWEVTETGSHPPGLISTAYCEQNQLSGNHACVLCAGTEQKDCLWGEILMLFAEYPAVCTAEQRRAGHISAWSRCR